MSEKPFKEPRLALNRIYTKRGDRGETSLVGGQRVGKDSLRIECYGTIDELNSFVGMAAFSIQELTAVYPSLGQLGEILLRVQHELFNLGSALATLPADLHSKQPQVTGVEVTRLEEDLDALNADLPELRSFVLPGGSRVNTELHACRTVCRRAERLLVALNRTEPQGEVAIQYLNRLSDAFFVWSRWTNRQLGVEEILWQPNLAASALPNE